MLMDADILDDILEGIDAEWVSGTYGDTLIHECCGSEIEMDGERCPDCGASNPLFGLI